MNTPFSSHAWRELQSRAAAELRPDFSDHVLRCARLSTGSSETAAGWMGNSFTLSALTAALCLILVLFVHAHLTEAANTQHLADWQEISTQTASIDLTP